jgi:hypothetical protein
LISKRNAAGALFLSETNSITFKYDVGLKGGSQYFLLTDKAVVCFQVLRLAPPHGLLHRVLEGQKKGTPKQ